MTMRTAALLVVFALTGCFDSHVRDGAGGSGGGGAFADGGSGGPGGGGGSGGGGGFADSGSGGSGGGSGSVVDAGVASPDAGDDELALLVQCVEVCDHLAACVMADPLDCVEGCIEVRESARDPECRALLDESFDCLLALECDEWASGDLSDTSCGPLLEATEDVCET